jgi:hypothetical protein
MEWWKKIAWFVALPGFLLGSFITVFSQVNGIRSGLAQEAQKAGAKAADSVVNVKMLPVEQRLEQLIELGQKEDDREEWKDCFARSYRDLSEEAREENCDAESDWRWAVWGWEEKGEEGPRPVLVLPHPPGG